MTETNNNIEINAVAIALIPHPRYSEHQPVVVFYQHHNKTVIDFTLLCYETNDALSVDIRNL